MSKKATAGVIVALIAGLAVGVAIGANKSLFPKDMGGVYVDASELKAELQKKNAKISLAEAVSIAERKSGGRVIGMRLRRLRLDNMGYALTILKNNPVSYEFVIVHSTTGEIILSQPGGTSYQIVAPVNERVNVTR